MVVFSFLEQSGQLGWLVLCQSKELGLVKWRKLPACVFPATNHMASRMLTPLRVARIGIIPISCRVSLD